MSVSVLVISLWSSAKYMLLGRYLVFSIASLCNQLSIAHSNLSLTYNEGLLFPYDNIGVPPQVRRFVSFALLLLICQKHSEKPFRLIYLMMTTSFDVAIIIIWCSNQEAKHTKVRQPTRSSLVMNLILIIFVECEPVKFE